MVLTHGGINLRPSISCGTANLPCSLSALSLALRVMFARGSGTSTSLQGVEVTTSRESLVRATAVHTGHVIIVVFTQRQRATRAIGHLVVVASSGERASDARSMVLTGAIATQRRFAELTRLPEVDALVKQGRVKVDGGVVKSPKTKLPVDCIIEVDGEPCEPVALLIAFHKPKGIITSLSDDWDRTDLSDVLPQSILRKHHPVGRLDGDTSGLLLLSSDGMLTHKLLSPRYDVEREYVATVDVTPLGKEPDESLVASLRRGVETADGVYRAHVRGIRGRDIRLIVQEGKHRMVRRMLANAGYPVTELRRERYGKIILGDIPEGEYQVVSGDASEWARSLLDGKSKEEDVGLSLRSVSSCEADQSNLS